MRTSIPQGYEIMTKDKNDKYTHFEREWLEAANLQNMDGTLVYSRSGDFDHDKWQVSFFRYMGIGMKPDQIYMRIHAKYGTDISIKKMENVKNSMVRHLKTDNLKFSNKWKEHRTTDILIPSTGETEELSDYDFYKAMAMRRMGKQIPDGADPAKYGISKDHKPVESGQKGKSRKVGLTREDKDLLREIRK